MSTRQFKSISQVLVSDIKEDSIKRKETQARLEKLRIKKEELIRQLDQSRHEVATKKL